VNNYMAQALLLSGDKGAAAVLGSATLTSVASEDMLGQLLTPRLVTPGTTIGQALQQAKAELALTHPELADVLLGWSLMGDPALMIEP
ncbi:MAG: C25 family cysteine peptidase, partial [Chloroflexota bacterium]